MDGRANETELLFPVRMQGWEHQMRFCWLFGSSGKVKFCPLSNKKERNERGQYVNGTVDECMHALLLMKFCKKSTYLLRKPQAKPNTSHLTFRN